MSPLHVGYRAGHAQKHMGEVLIIYIEVSDTSKLGICFVPPSILSSMPGCSPIATLLFNMYMYISYYPFQ